MQSKWESMHYCHRVYCLPQTSLWLAKLRVGRFHCVKMEAKCDFYLLPTEGIGLKGLFQARANKFTSHALWGRGEVGLTR